MPVTPLNARARVFCFSAMLANHKTAENGSVRVCVCVWGSAREKKKKPQRQNNAQGKVKSGGKWGSGEKRVYGENHTHVACAAALSAFAT